MKIDAFAGLAAQVSPGASSISFARENDFASKLTLGQIIKGRVLRSYEGSRYLVNFGGHEKVVDSAVPLRPDEVIVGRVVGLGEKVEVQRINSSLAEPVSAATVPRTATQLSGSTGQLIAGLFEQFQAQLAPADMAMLQRVVQRAAAPEAMALTGLLFAKIGIPLSPEALRAVFDALRADARRTMFALPGEAIQLETQAGNPADAPVPVAPAFSALLAGMLKTVPGMPPAVSRRGAESDATRTGGAGASPGDAMRDRPREEPAPDVARLILNVQAGGSVKHRVGTLPLLVDGRLIELDVALFEQPAGNDGRSDEVPPLQHRQVVLAVTTEMLGRVEVRAAMAGSHMRVQMSTQAKESAQYLAQHAGRLTAELEEHGWHVDELAYQTTKPAAFGVVAQTVVEHLIAPGSVSALA